MAVTLDATSLLNSGAAAVASLTVSHTCTGSNLVLWTGFSYTGSSTTITSITYNGVGMTRITTVDATASYHVALYYLVNPATGANNIVVTPSASCSIFGGSQSFTGASQSAPTNSAVNSGSGLLASVILTTGFSNSMVVDTVGMANASSTLTAGGLQTQDYNQSDGTAARTGAGSHEAVSTPAATTMSWTISGVTSRSWGHIAAELDPVAAPATSSPSTTMMMGI